MKNIFIVFVAMLVASCVFNSELGEKFQNLSSPATGMSKIYIYNVRSGNVPAFVRLNGVEYKVSEYAYLELDMTPKTYDIELIGVWANVKTGVTDRMTLKANEGETYFLRINQIRDPDKPYGERMYTTELKNVDETQALSELISKGREILTNQASGTP